MHRSLDERTSRLLDIQGFEAVDRRHLAEVAPWLRFAFGLCTLLALVGTVTASPVILLGLTVVAALGAALPVHPFDLIYAYGIRPLIGTAPLPKRGAPARFACGLAVAWLSATSCPSRTKGAPTKRGTGATPAPSRARLLSSKKSSHTNRGTTFRLLGLRR